MSASKMLVLVGPPGAGKGTQGALLCDYYCIPHLSTGVILRRAKAEGTALGRIVGPIMDSGGLVSDELMVQVVRERILAPDCRKGFLLDGFPRSVPQAEALEQITLESSRPLDAVIELRVERHELMKRLVNRFDELDNPRPEDRPEAVPHRLDLYDRITSPLLGWYGERNKLLTVDGLGSQDEVFQRIITGIAAMSDILPGCQVD
jgi:adenylate kinase